MLYILGGAPRAGKSILAKKMLKEKQISYFPTDALIGVLSQSAPEYKINHDVPFIEKSKKLWKFTKVLFGYFIEEEDNFLVEGDAILPEQAAEMLKEYPNQTKACFVGYVDMTPEEKLGTIRSFKQEIDWTDNHNDKALLEMIDQMIQYSKYIKNECAQYNLKYFDLSDDFGKTHEEIFQYLLN